MNLAPTLDEFRSLSRRARQEYVSDRFLRHGRSTSKARRARRVLRKRASWAAQFSRKHAARMLEWFGLDLTGAPAVDARRRLRNARKQEARS